MSETRGRMADGTLCIAYGSSWVGGYQEDAFRDETLPEKLTHSENVRYLTGGMPYLGFDVESCVEQTLRQYAEVENLLQLSRYPNASARTIRLDVSQSGEVRGNTFPSDKASGPCLTIGIDGPDGTAEEYQFSLHAILWNAPELRGRYQIYAHGFGPDHVGMHYIGITKRGWLCRWREHLASARGGSPYRFHAALASTLVNAPKKHIVLACGLDFKSAMDGEEDIVKKLSLYPLGLNMIPGGFEGAKFLSNLGAQWANSPRQWEYRERLVHNLVQNSARRGIPNPLAAAAWQSDEYAAQVICANHRNFTRAGVRQARSLAAQGVAPQDIARVIDSSARRVKNLLAGRTYTRVK